MERSGKSKSRVSGKSRSTAGKRDELLREVEELRARLEEAEATIEAIQSGSVDGLVIAGPDGAKVFALEGADYPYRVMLEVLNEGVLTLDADGGILSCNSRFIAFLQRPMEQILGRRLADFVVRRDAPTLRSFLREAAVTGSVVTICLALADGTSMTTKLSGAAFKVGEVPALCVVVTDMTEAMNAIKTRSLLASIVETSNDAIVSLSVDDRILTWNAAAERILGFSAQEAVGQTISLIMPRDRIHEVEQIRERICLGKHAQGHDTLRITKLGAPIHVALTASPLMDTDGNVTGMSMILRDITERKKVEAELERHRANLEALVQQRTRELVARTEQLRVQHEEILAANAQLRSQSDALRKSEERGRLALHAGRMATWDWQILADEVVWNDEHYRMLGYEIGTVKPGYEEWIARVHPDDQAATDAAFRAAMTDGFDYSKEFRICLPDGNIHWCWAIGGFERDATGRAIRSFGVMQDITEEKEVKLRVQELNEALVRHGLELEESNKELDSFTHSVSHDLRSPLRLTNKIANLLLHDHGAQLPAGAVEKIHMILNSTHEMGKLIEDLLLFSQAKSEPMKRHRVDMRRLAREALDEFRDERQGRNVEVQIGNLPPCDADRALLKQVFLNLIGNALKFTRPCERAEIRVGFTQPKGGTVYFVRDNGVGFDMGHADAVFLVFHRLHKAHSFEGSGVGLALTKRIIERHGGRIWAEGKTNGGATFHFTLGTQSAG